MKLQSHFQLLATVLVSLSTIGQAEKYPAGTICRTNRDCDANCLDAQWIITAQDNGYAFACDPATPNPTQYYVAISKPGVYKAYAPTAVKNTGLACDVVNGTMCNHACFFSGKKSAEDDARASWFAACQANSDLEPTFLVFDSSDEARAKVGCS